MLKKLILSVFLALSFTYGNAENNPYHADHLWVTTPNHADWLYECGEKATIEVQLYKYGISCDAEVSYTISDDLQPADTKGALTLRKGRASLNIGTKKSPGFRCLTLNAKVDGQTTTHHIKVGFSADKIQPYTKEPADFRTFWQAEVEKAEKFPLQYTRTIAEEYCTDKVVCELIKLRVDNTHSIYAYLTYPRNAKNGSCPAVICPPGAGIKTIKLPMRHKFYAENGFIRLETEIHGLDPRLPESTFKEIQSAFAAKGNNYLENGLDCRENYYMRHVYLSLIKAIDFMASLPQWDGKNMAFQGGSQGGALALIAAGLSPRVTHVVANHPALSDMAGYAEKGRTGGYPHFNKTNQMLTPEKIKVMAYYDVINFARHIKCPVYMTWGYNDNTCPPTTSYAVWNTLQTEKEALLTPVNEHWTSDATARQQMQWIKQHLR